MTSRYSDTAISARARHVLTKSHVDRLDEITRRLEAVVNRQERFLSDLEHRLMHDDAEVHREDSR